MGELLLDWTHRGKTFEISVGDLVRVSLWGNATTGFFWSPMLPNDGALEPATDESSRRAPDTDDEPPPVAGAGSPTHLLFRARQPGEQHLVIRYWRGAQAPEDVVYEVTLKIQS